MMRLHTGVAHLALLAAAACGQRTDLADACSRASAPQAHRALGVVHVYVDGSTSMAPFLAPENGGTVVTAYEEMLLRVFTGGPPRDSVDTWLFGDTLLPLSRGPAARQALMSRASYDRTQSRLELAFGHAEAFLDSTAVPSTVSGMAIVLTDGLQSGSGRQLHVLAELDRILRDHVGNGGSFAFVAGPADRYPKAGRQGGGAAQTAPVMAFLLGSAGTRDAVAQAARALADGLDRRTGEGNARVFVLPVRAAADVGIRPRSGVRQVLSSDADPEFTFRTDAAGLELIAEARFDTLEGAHLPPLSAHLDRCVANAWQPVDDRSGWSAEVVAVDSATGSAKLAIRRSDAAAVRTGTFRLRLEGNPVPAWISEVGGDRAGTEDIARFFGGMAELRGTSAASFGTIYLHARSD